MPKINIPLGENGGKDYSSEAAKLNELITDVERTTTGVTEFTSESSGIYYSTEDYPDDTDVYNMGDLGMIRLLRKLYGGSSGWLVMADDLNDKQPLGVYTTVQLAHDSWEGDDSPFTQTIVHSAITPNTKIDLYPDEAAFAQLAADGVTALLAKNTNGTAVAVCIGKKPTADISVGAELTEMRMSE